MKGTTGESIKAKGDYDSESNATYTLEKIRARFAQWLEWYHAEEHSSLGMSPNEAWSRAQSCQFPPRRYSEDDLRRYFWRAVEVTPTRSGRVRYQNLHWWGGSVSFLANRYPKVKKLLLFIDPGNVANAWLSHPLHLGDPPQQLEPLHPHYQEGLTLHFHQEIWKAKMEFRAAHKRCSTTEARVQLMWDIAHDNKHKSQRKTSDTVDDSSVEKNLLEGLLTKNKKDQEPSTRHYEYRKDTPDDFSVSEADE